MTIDTRRPNVWTIPLSWPMTDLESAPRKCKGKKKYCWMDAIHMFWQFALAIICREIFTFATPWGNYTPNRILMGGTDSVPYVQAAMEEIFAELIADDELLVWIDDILGFAEDDEKLLKVIRRILQACAKYGLKLHPAKCCFYAEEAEWCGKIISGEGVRHNPTRLEGLTNMEEPVDAAQLQQFLCAINWMRASIPEYAKLTGKLNELLDKAGKAASSRKKTKLAKVNLKELGWTQEHSKAMTQVKEALTRMVPLVHPDQEQDVCLFTDASLDYWGAVATQVPPEDKDKPVEERRHSPLAFLSGKFVSAAARWPIIEKEAFAIVESCKRLDYLLLRPKGFHLFTDHRNLVYIFNPKAVDGNMARYQADKLQRWGIIQVRRSTCTR